MTKIKTALTIAGCAAAAMLVLHPVAKAETDADGFIRIKQGEEQYKNPFGVGVEVATLFGDPSKPGIYIQLNRFHPGNFSRPHWHENDRYIMVLSGNWWVATGARFVRICRSVECMSTMGVPS